MAKDIYNKFFNNLQSPHYQVLEELQGIPENPRHKPQ